MTKEQRQLLREFGMYCPTPPPFMPLGVAQIVSPTPDNIAHVEVSLPLAAEHFNGVSLQDIAALHKYKGSDELHRPDIVSQDFSRGQKLTEYLNKVGKEKFVDDWFKFHPSK